MEALPARSVSALAESFPSCSTRIVAPAISAPDSVCTRIDRGSACAQARRESGWRHRQDTQISTTRRQSMDKFEPILLLQWKYEQRIPKGISSRKDHPGRVPGLLTSTTASCRFPNVRAAPFVAFQISKRFRYLLLSRS